MRIPRIHLPETLVVGAELELPEAATRHLARVLRLGPGAAICLFNGRGGEYAAQLTEVTKRTARARIEAFAPRECELPFEVVLAQAVSRTDRMDLTLQKAVELGATTIVPLTTARSAPLPAGERLARRVDHWRGIVASACEQCGRNRLPGVSEPTAFAHWLPDAPSGNRLMLDPEAGTPLHAVALTDAPVVLLVGAEGGLSDEELAAARHSGFIGVGLGPRVLRTETAALVALAQLQLLHPARSN